MEKYKNHRVTYMDMGHKMGFFQTGGSFSNKYNFEVKFLISSESQICLVYKHYHPVIVTVSKKNAGISKCKY